MAIRFYVRHKADGRILRYNDIPAAWDSLKEDEARFYLKLENSSGEVWELVDDWPEEPTEPYQFPFWSQRDDRWKSEQLGHGTSTIGGFGCLITSAAMMGSAALKQDITPHTVNQWLKSNGGYTGENMNLMYFAKLWEMWPGIEGAGIYDWHTIPADLSKINEVIDRGGWGLTKIDFKTNTAKVDEHWVLIYGREGNVYQIADPWDGNAHLLPPAYCKEGWDAARAIFKVALYELV